MRILFPYANSDRQQLHSNGGSLIAPIHSQLRHRANHSRRRGGTPRARFKWLVQTRGFRGSPKLRSILLVAGIRSDLYTWYADELTAIMARRDGPRMIALERLAKL